MYTFKETAYGTVEVFKDGIRIATTTPQSAALNYGYGNAPPPVTALEQVQAAGGTSIGTVNQQPQAIAPTSTTPTTTQSTFGRVAEANEDKRRVANQNVQNYLRSIGVSFTTTSDGWTNVPLDIYIPWNTDGTLAIGGLGNDPGNTGQSAYQTYITQHPELVKQIQPAAAPTQTATQAAVDTGSSTPTTDANLVGLPPELQQLYTSLSDFLDEMKKRGQVLNPNIEITPDKLAEFATQASREIDPYYANLLKTNVDEFVRSVGYGKEQLLQGEQELGRQFGTQTRQLGEQAAERGFAQSGLRQRDERELALGTQNKINQGRQQFGFDAGNVARSLAGEFGTSNVPTFNLGNAPTAGAGERTLGISGGESPLYNLSDSVYSGLTGTKQYEQDVAKRSRASELESAFRSNLALDQMRSLTI